jgi:hypothetical protein
MKTIQKMTMLFLLLLPFIGMAETMYVQFTLEDRDRMIRTEQKLEALDAKIDSKVDGLNTKIDVLNTKIDSKIDGLRLEMNARFDAIDKRFDQLFNFLWAFIGIFTAMMVSVFGFAFWDRKLSLYPIKRENRKTLNALRDYAEHQPKLREILKNAGLM